MSKKLLLIASFFLLFFGINNLSLLFIGFLDIDFKLFSQPIRLLMLLCFVLLAFFFRSPKKIPNVFRNSFIIFISLFLFRIYFDIFSGENYYLSYDVVFFYFCCFVLIPFLSILNINFSRSDLITIKKVFLFSSALFCLLIVIKFNSFLGQITRLNIGEESDGILSPLLLSYNSSIIIGVCLYDLVNKKNSLLEFIFYVVLIVFSFVPFSLGASRGAVLSLFFSLIFIFYALKLNIKTVFFSLIILSFFSIFFNYYSDLLFSGLIERFDRSNAFNNLIATKDIRYIIWENSFNQFLNNPLIGDKLATDNWINYPHNLIIEAFQSIGLIGTVPLMIILFLPFKFIKNLLKNNKEFGWITIVFIQVLVQSMFSFSLIKHPFLFFVLPTLIVFYYTLKNKNSNL